MTLRARLLIDYYVGGALHLLLKAVVIFLGRVLKRNHDLKISRDITVLKMLGGGSLIIAYPSLLAIKNRAGTTRLRVVTTPSTKPFAELLGIFDEIIVIRDGGFAQIIVDSLKAIRRLWRCDTLIDLEVHSRLSTIFCLVTCARNRIGFYTLESFWRKSISTHLLFLHVNSPVYDFYDQVAQLLEAPAVSFAESGRVFTESLDGQGGASLVVSDERRLAIAPSCSGLGRERMMRPDEWAIVLKREIVASGAPSHIDLLGATADRAELDAIQIELARELPDAKIVNHAGRLSLKQSVDVLRQASRLLAIDSSLLHVAALLQIPCTSFWGPTSPATRLQLLDSDLHTIHYQKLPCSPCVHVSAAPPCHGNNLCMRLAVDPDLPINRNPPWLAQPANPE